LLTALVLYYFGSGAIRGFATTLIIGIFTSLFSAIVLTRLVFFTRLENKKPISFYSNTTKNWFTNINVDFLGKRRLAYIISGSIIVLGLASMFTRNFDLGIDFTGGSTFDVKFEQPVDIQQVRTLCADAFAENGKQGNPRIQTKESNAQLRIMTNFLQNSDASDVDEQINGAAKAALSQLGVPYVIERYNKVDSTISDDFRNGARNATLFSLLVIFLYLVLRFRRWQYGLGALLAMVHDVLIVLAVFSFGWGFLPFTMEIDQAFIAAILTVIGYSINDTVVVFDRIREYIGLYGSKSDQKKIINDSLNSTLSRTINTSLTTFVVLLSIFLFGGDNIKGFVFALLVGVVVGTYSSIFIATPVAYDLGAAAARKKS
jgi:SecD/SecF fusion protein